MMNHAWRVQSSSHETPQNSTSSMTLRRVDFLNLGFSEDLVDAVTMGVDPSISFEEVVEMLREMSAPSSATQESSESHETLMIHLQMFVDAVNVVAVKLGRVSSSTKVLGDASELQAKFKVAQSIVEVLDDGSVLRAFLFSFPSSLYTFQEPQTRKL